MSELVKDLRSLSDEEIISRHDALSVHTVVGTQHYLDELARRDLDRQTQAMLAYTRQVRNFTIVITVLTLINVVLAGILIYR